MHRNHLTSCVVLLAAAALIAVALGVPAGALAVAAVLVICPLMMVAMMYFMTAGRNGVSDRDGS